MHPWFYALLAFELAQDMLFARPESLLGGTLWLVAWFDLITGYLGAMALALITARARGYRDLVGQVPLMPAYWLLISAAAYRAAWQFWRARFTWEKTEHGLARTVS